jgi:hypothetical protein
VAVLLIGGNKTGDNRWYQTYLPVADRIYDQHLRELKAEDEKKAGDEKTKTKEEKKDEL